jgi:predicted  nucleic acid-binding Zn-ribbon protein
VPEGEAMMADRGEVFVSMPDEQLGRLSLIEAIRANTDAVNRLARHGEMQDEKLDKINTTLGRIDTRLTLLERATLKDEVARNRVEIDDHESRLKVIEARESERAGASKFADALLKYGPFLIALVTALFIVLVATGRIAL